MSEFLTGKFTVKEDAEGAVSIVYESGPGPIISLELFADQQPIATAQDLANTLNVAVAAIRLEGT